MHETVKISPTLREVETEKSISEEEKADTKCSLEIIFFYTWPKDFTPFTPGVILKRL